VFRAVPGSALLDLRNVELEQVVEPGQQLLSVVEHQSVSPIITGTFGAQGENRVLLAGVCEDADLDSPIAIFAVFGSFWQPLLYRVVTLLGLAVDGSEDGELACVEMVNKSSASVTSNNAAKTYDALGSRPPSWNFFAEVKASKVPSQSACVESAAWSDSSIEPSRSS